MAYIGTLEAVIKLRDEFSSTLQHAGDQLARSGKKFEQLGQSMTRHGMQLTTAITAPLAIVGGLAVKTFASFDKAMTESIAIMGDVSDAMRDDMTAAARDVAKTTTFSAEQAAQSFFYLASAGLSAEQSIAALPRVAEFAQAGAFDMARATDLLTDAQSALGLTIRDDVVKNMENMVRVSDVLVKANTLSNATVEQFSTSLTSEAGAAMKSFGIDVEEGVAVLAAFADQGVKAEVAGNALSRILRLMTSAALENAEVYEKLGIEVFDASGEIRNMADIVEDLEDALLHLSDENRVAALEMLGFQARVQGVIMPLLGTSDAIRRYEGELRNAGDTTRNVSEKQLQSFSNQLLLVKHRLQDAFLTLGETIMPTLVGFVQQALVPAIDKLAQLADWFSQLPTPVRNTALAFAALLAAAGPVLLIAGQLTIALGALAPVLGPLVAKIGAVVTALTGPAGWVVAAAALLLSLRPVREFLIDMYSRIFTAVASAVTAIIAKFREWWAATEETRGFLVRFAQVVANDVINGIKNLIGRARELIQWLAGVGEKSADLLKRFGRWSGITEIVRGATAKFTKNVKELWKAIVEVTQSILKWIGGIEGVLGVLSLVVPGLAIAVKKLKEWAAQANAAQVTVTQRFNPALVQAEYVAEKLVKQTDKVSVSFEKVGDEAQKAAPKVERLWKQAETAAEYFERLFADTVVLINGFPIWTRGLQNVTDAANDAAEAHEVFAAATDELVEGVPMVVRGTRELSDAAQEAADNWARAMQQIEYATADAIYNILTLLLEGGDDISGQIEEIFAQFGKAAGAAIGMYYGGPAGAAVGGALGEFLGRLQGSWIGSLFEKGPTLAERIGWAFEALADGIPTLEELYEASRLLVEMLTLTERGLYDTAYASNILAQNFDAFVEAALRTGEGGYEAIRRVVEAARAAGVDIEVIEAKLRETLEEAQRVLEERNRFLAEQSRSLIASVISIMTETGRAGARAVEFAATSVVQAFEMMQAAGLPLSQILAELAVAFDVIRERGLELGVELPEPFERFGQMLDILTTDKFRRLIERLEAVGSAAQAAGNMGILTAEQFDFFGDRLRATFREMVRGGLSSEEALAALAPQLQLLHDLSQQYGFELDRNTQRLLDQALAQGVVADRGLTTEDILIRGFDRMLEALNRLIEALGGVPVEFENWSDAIEDTADVSRDAFRQMQDDIEEFGETSDEVFQSIEGSAMRLRDRLERQFGNIPFGLGGGGFGGMMQAQFGTGRYIDFGAGTPVMLHGREQVVTAGEGADIASMVALAIQGGASGASSQRERLILLTEQALRETTMVRAEVARLKHELADQATVGAGRRWQ